MKKLLIGVIYIISGFAMSLPIIFDALPILSWIAMIPALICEFSIDHIKKKHIRHAYLRGFLYFYSFGLGVFFWFIELYPLDFAGMTKEAAVAVVLVAWLGLPLLQAAVSSLLFVCFDFMMGRCKLAERSFLVPLAFASLYSVFEYLQTLTWAGVPWAKLALTQTGSLAFLQSSSLLGPYFISFIIVLVNSFAAVGIVTLVKNRKGSVLSLSPYICIAVSVLIFSANLIYGSVRIANIHLADQANSIKVAAIQGNISSKDKWDEDKSADSLEIYSDLTRRAASIDAELVVWPETAIPYTYNAPYNSDLRSAVASLAEENGCEILLGAFSKEDGKQMNSIFYVDGTGALSDTTYSKRRLVPFGEFVPMRDIIMTLIPPLAEISMLDTDLSPGDSATVISTEKADIGCIICFDSIYESLARASVNNGAELLTVSTNDSWFSDSKAIYEHNRHSVLRAIENSRYIVRAANTGISSVISPIGEVMSSTEPLVEDIIVADVCPVKDLTFYTKTGDIILAVNLLIIVISAVYSAISKKHTARGIL